MKVIITILDGIKETSMPFNEFVLWRANHYKDERQHLIICNNEAPLPKVFIPDSIQIDYIGKNVLTWRKAIIRVLNKYDAEGVQYAIHLHQAGPSMKIFLTMMGTKFWRNTVFTVHNSFKGYPIHNKIRSYFDGCMAKYVVCCGKSSFESYPKSVKHMKGDRVLFIQNGVDTERIDGMIDSVGTVNSAKYVVFTYVARMVPVKNHGFLIDVIKKSSPKAKFLLIGKPEEVISRRIKDEGLSDRVEVTGLIPRNEVFRKLKASDVYVSTSTLEGLPVSVLEGMYVGLPVVLSDIPQHREVVGSHVFAKLLPFDVDEWVAVINNCVEMSSEQRTLLGKNSRVYVRDHFSLITMHRQYDRIYKQIMSN